MIGAVVLSALLTAPAADLAKDVTDPGSPVVVTSVHYPAAAAGKEPDRRTYCIDFRTQKPMRLIQFRIEHEDASGTPGDSYDYKLLGDIAAGAHENCFAVVQTTGDPAVTLIRVVETLALDHSHWHMP